MMGVSSICRACPFSDICEYEQTESANSSDGYATSHIVCEKKTIVANGIPNDFLSYRVDIDRELYACDYYRLYSRLCF